MERTFKGPHVVLRIKQKIRIRLNELDVIEEHNRIFEKVGYVALGKFGASWNQTKCDDFAKEIGSGATKHLYLVFKTDSGYKGFRAKIRNVVLAGRSQARLLAYPDNYNQLQHQPNLFDSVLAKKPSMWFELAERLESHSLKKLRLLSNDRPLLDSLNQSRAAMMLVTEKS
jgi:hypothetical protein